MPKQNWFFAFSLFFLLICKAASVKKANYCGFKKRGERAFLQFAECGQKEEEKKEVECFPVIKNNGYEKFIIHAERNFPQFLLLLNLILFNLNNRFLVNNYR